MLLVSQGVPCNVEGNFKGGKTPSKMRLNAPCCVTAYGLVPISSNPNTFMQMKSPRIEARACIKRS